MKALLLLALVALCRSEEPVLMQVEPDMLPGWFLSGGSEAASDSPCIDPHLASCQVGFNRALNITGNADWSSVAVLARALDTYFISGVQGLLTVCNARTQFYQCLGTSYNSCINRMYFLSKGMSEQNAYGYVEVMKQLEFMCGGGVMQAVRSWGCILNVEKTYQSTFTQCRNAFNATYTQDPNSLCKAAQDLMNCFRFPFIATCGGQVGWWECELIRVAFEIGSFCPDLQCHISKSKDADQQQQKGEEPKAELKPKHPSDMKFFSERMFKELERMANNVKYTEEEKKLAGDV